MYKNSLMFNRVIYTGVIFNLLFNKVYRQYFVEDFFSKQYFVKDSSIYNRLYCRLHSAVKLSELALLDFQDKPDIPF